MTSTPPSGTPDGTPEYLDLGRGHAAPSVEVLGAEPPRRRRGRILLGGGLLALAAVGVGGWYAWGAYFGTGAQPAEALPAGTLAYASLDLDPSGQQKLAALEVFEKFPALAEEAGIDRDTDLRELLLDDIHDGGECEDVDFEDDVAPWLGNKFAIAAIDLGDDNPEGSPVAPVGVVEVSNVQGALDGIAAFHECLAVGDLGGWAVEGDWAVVAETEQAAQKVISLAREGSLADDADYRQWTGEIGDPGVLSGYLSPGAGAAFAEGMTAFLTSTEPTMAPAEIDLLSDVFQRTYGELGGMAMTVRFADGGVEVDAASDVAVYDLQGMEPVEGGGEAAATLPDDTAVALGMAFGDDFLDTYFEMTADMMEGMDLGAQMPPTDELIEQLELMIEQTTGLTVDELQQLPGEATALALGPDVDAAAVERGDLDGTLPLAIRADGDGETVAGLVDRLLANPALPAGAADLVSVENDADHAVVGLDDDWSRAVLGGGSLGETQAYRDVVVESDRATSVLFVDFDRLGWTEELVDDPAVWENLQPLGALGWSAWVEDDVARSVFKVTTD